jgi:hypothetical protein
MDARRGILVQILDRHLRFAREQQVDEGSLEVLENAVLMAHKKVQIRTNKRIPQYTNDNHEECGGPAVSVCLCLLFANGDFVIERLSYSVSCLQRISPEGPTETIL